MRGEEGMLSISIRVEVDDKTDKLDIMSRIHYGKIYTIEHNVKVRSLGMVNNSHRTALLTQFHTVFSRRIGVSAAPMTVARVDPYIAGSSRQGSTSQRSAAPLQGAALTARQRQALNDHSATHALLAARRTAAMQADRLPGAGSSASHVQSTQPTAAEGDAVSDKDDDDGHSQGESGSGTETESETGSVTSEEHITSTAAVTDLRVQQGRVVHGPSAARDPDQDDDVQEDDSDGEETEEDSEGSASDSDAS